MRYISFLPYKKGKLFTFLFCITVSFINTYSLIAALPSLAPPPPPNKIVQQKCNWRAGTATSVLDRGLLGMIQKGGTQSWGPMMSYKSRCVSARLFQGDILIADTEHLIIITKGAHIHPARCSKVKMSLNRKSMNFLLLKTRPPIGYVPELMGSS